MYEKKNPKNKNAKNEHVKPLSMLRCVTNRICFSIGYLICPSQQHTYTHNYLFNYRWNVCDVCIQWKFSPPVMHNVDMIICDRTNETDWKSVKERPYRAGSYCEEKLDLFKNINPWPSFVYSIRCNFLFFLHIYFLLAKLNASLFLFLRGRNKLFW